MGKVRDLDRRIGMRLPAEVADAWKAAAKAAGRSLSDWIRAQVAVGGVVVTGKPSPARVPKRRAEAQADPALVREVAKVGNNLNQVARKLNSGGVLDEEAVLALWAIERRLGELLEREKGD